MNMHNPVNNCLMYVFAAEKGNQGLAWSEEEDELLAQHFTEGAKINQLAKLHSRT
jgi:hypothetical protein